MAMPRVNFLGGPQFYNLQCAAATLVQALGPQIYLVGSALERRDWRDVDVRCILEDREFDRRFPGSKGLNPNSYDAWWALSCAAISDWLSARTGLPVDFQIQRATQAEQKEKGARYPLARFGSFAADSQLDIEEAIGA